MAVRTKGRRKITVSERMFVWYIKPDFDSADMVLHVVSDDKQFNVQYSLDQPEQTRHISIIGKEFGGTRPVGNVGRFLCPQWEVDGVISPQSVRRLIEWCLSADKPLVAVDWQGKPIE
jgi:hypothetical protein